MEETIMKEFIEFWIDNWCWELIYEKLEKNNPFNFYIQDNEIIVFNIDDQDEVFRLNIIETITSKEFIDAIARWLEKKKYDMSCIWWDELCTIRKQLIIQQALAIYNNELPLFIKKILWKN